MVGYVYNTGASFAPHPYSLAAMAPITLAAFEDTGWYTVNYTRAGVIAWGHNAGCQFHDLTCDQYAYQNPDQPWFCKSTDAYGSICSPERYDTQTTSVNT